MIKSLILGVLKKKLETEIHYHARKKLVGTGHKSPSPSSSLAISLWFPLVVEPNRALLTGEVAVIGTAPQNSGDRDNSLITGTSDHAYTKDMH